MIVRQKSNLIEDVGFKKRKVGLQGKPQSMDSEDEDFVAKSIEDKATYHGRRHDTVLYTNRRVKSRDLVNILNYRHEQRGYKQIRSCTTVWNRSKPKRQGTIQSTKHLGKGLWCTRKPPKTEENDNECTHHQRAHVNNMKRFFFSEKTQHATNYVFCRSIDDKAYIRPGTGEGMAGVRNQRILTPVANDKVKKLPMHDWPEKTMYATPSAHRIFTKSGEASHDGREVLLTQDDNHIVYVRPKFYTGSSGTVWANETMELRYNLLHLFEVPNRKAFSTLMRCLCARFRDSLVLFLDMTEKDDILRVSTNTKNTHTLYELKRLQHLQEAINRFLADKEMLCSRDNTELENISVTSITDSIYDIRCMFTSACDVANIVNGFTELQVHIKEYIDNLDGLNLPQVKPRWCDLTDAGPGVGVSNNEVKFRDAEMCRIFHSDYRIRIHRAREDSGQNESERTNSASGDAICDGGSLQWEYFKQFENLTDDEISALSIKDFEELEDERMEKNAWKVCEEVVNRLDGAPVLGEHIRACLTPKHNKSFFFNRDELVSYFSSNSETQRKSAAGYFYIRKIMTFFETQPKKFHIKFSTFIMGFKKCHYLSNVEISSS